MLRQDIGDDLLNSIIEGDDDVRLNIEKGTSASSSASKDKKTHKSNDGLNYIELQESTLKEKEKEKPKSKDKLSSAIIKETLKSLPKEAAVTATPPSTLSNKKANVVTNDNYSELKEEKPKQKTTTKVKKKAKKTKDSDYDSDSESLCGCGIFGKKKKSNIAKNRIRDYEDGSYVPPQVKNMNSPK